jgi:hypothetical protein
MEKVALLARRYLATAVAPIVPTLSSQLAATCENLHFT